MERRTSFARSVGHGARCHGSCPGPGHAVYFKSFHDVHAFDGIYSSDLQRTMNTAKAIASALDIADIQSVPELRETHLGTFQGQTRIEIHQDKTLAALYAKFQQNDQFCAPEGERYAWAYEVDQ